MVVSYAAKNFVKILIKAQNSTIRQILDMPWNVRNFHIYTEIELPRLNDFIQHLKLNFHLALENTENNVLNTLAEYDHNDSIIWKRLRQACSLAPSFKPSPVY